MKVDGPTGQLQSTQLGGWMIDVLVDLSFRMFGLFVRALFDLSSNSPQNCIKTAFSGLER